jgi:hypothetical protein
MEENTAAEIGRRGSAMVRLDSTDEGAMTRWELIWKVIVFQIKLVLDGFRDLVLSPLSIIAAVLGVLASPNNPGYFFTRLLNWGRQTEKWINLFDQHSADDEDKSIDDYICHIETAIRRDHERGGVSASTQQKVDAILDNLRRAQRRSD